MKIYADKTYRTPEEGVYRERIFRSSFQYCKGIDEQYKNGTLSYSVNINYFADLVSEDITRLSPIAA